MVYQLKVSEKCVPDGKNDDIWYSIEYKQVGKWWTYEKTKIFIQACRSASYVCERYGTSETSVRIIDENGREY